MENVNRDNSSQTRDRALSEEQDASNRSNCPVTQCSTVKAVSTIRSNPKRSGTSNWVLLETEIPTHERRGALRTLVMEAVARRMYPAPMPTPFPSLDTIDPRLIKMKDHYRAVLDDLMMLMSEVESVSRGRLIHRSWHDVIRQAHVDEQNDRLRRNSELANRNRLEAGNAQSENLRRVKAHGVSSNPSWFTTSNSNQLQRVTPNLEREAESGIPNIGPLEMQAASPVPSLDTNDASLSENEKLFRGTLNELVKMMHETDPVSGEPLVHPCWGDTLMNAVLDEQNRRVAPNRNGLTNVNAQQPGGSQ